MSKNPAIAVIEFVVDCIEPQAFLKCWLEGDWDTIANEWPEAPTEVYCLNQNPFDESDPRYDPHWCG